MENKKQSAAYLPFKTLLTAFDHLHGHGMPNKIDHTAFPSFSGIVRSQVISAFRFFNLIDENGATQPLLHELASKPDERKELIKQLLERHYSDIIEQDLARMIPSQLDQAFASDKYAVNGDTRAKAKAFFLKAAEFAQMPISPRITQRTRAARGSRTRKAANSNGRNSAGSDTPAATDQKQQDVKSPPVNLSPAMGTTKTVLLSNAGSLTLAIDINLWELKGRDREFAFSLMDQIDAYEKRGAEDSKVAADTANPAQ